MRNLTGLPCTGDAEILECHRIDKNEFILARTSKQTVLSLLHCGKGSHRISPGSDDLSDSYKKMLANEESFIFQGTLPCEASMFQMRTLL